MLILFLFPVLLVPFLVIWILWRENAKLRSWAVQVREQEMECSKSREACYGLWARALIRQQSGIKLTTEEVAAIDTADDSMYEELRKLSRILSEMP